MAQYIVDATSPSYQVDAAYAPDKQSLWAHPMESDGWTHAYNAIRYELAAMSGVLAKLGSRPLSAWEVESMQAWWKGHAIHIHDHQYACSPLEPCDHGAFALYIESCSRAAQPQRGREVHEPGGGDVPPRAHPDRDVLRLA